MRRVDIEGIPNSISSLIGFELGEKIYKDNKLDDLELEEKVELVFPNTIEKFSASFVQGFF